jgi:hypothetical protein
MRGANHANLPGAKNKMKRVVASIEEMRTDRLYGYQIAGGVINICRIRLKKEPFSPLDLVSMFSSAKKQVNAGADCP